MPLEHGEPQFVHRREVIVNELLPWSDFLGYAPGGRGGVPIRRFADKEGDDGKIITCAGSQQVYNEFIEFVAGEG